MAATTTPPDVVRGELQAITGEAALLLAAAAAERATDGPEAVRGVLFDAMVAVAEEYKAAAAELAVAWYDELRDAADLLTDLPEFPGFVAEPVAVVDRAALQTTIAVDTTSLYDLIQADLDRQAADYEQLLGDAVDTSMRLLQGSLQKEIAAGFRDTITDNTVRDDSAVGWRRHTRPSESYPDGCRFCRLLADKGAIYSKSTARFAAHKGCHCVASPVFDGEDGPEASVMQYLASQRNRTRAENKKLRAYLQKKYGDDERADRDHDTADDRTDGGASKKPEPGNATETIDSSRDPATKDAGNGGQPPTNRPTAAGGFGEEPDDPNAPEGEAYWDRRRRALGLDYGDDYRSVRPPEIKTVERLLARGDTLVPIPRRAETDSKRNFSSASDYYWTPAGTDQTFRVEIKSLEDDTRLHGATFPLRIKKSVGRSKAHGKDARKRAFLVDAGDRTEIPAEVYDALRSYNQDNPDHRVDRIWLLVLGEPVVIDLD